LAAVLVPDNAPELRLVREWLNHSEEVSMLLRQRFRAQGEDGKEYEVLVPAPRWHSSATAPWLKDTRTGLRSLDFGHGLSAQSYANETRIATRISPLMAMGATGRLLCEPSARSLLHLLRGPRSGRLGLSRPIEVAQRQARRVD
jgi:hypothetical protein